VRPVTLAALVCAAALTTACGAEEGPPTVAPGAGGDDGLERPAGDDREQPDLEGPGQGTGGGGAAPADLDAATDVAVADLAAAEGVDAADVEVVAAERVTWSDGSLGCPEPGMMYTQALVPGYRIVLRVGDSEVHYHGSEDGPPARCDDPRPPSDPGS
jgi:hypothetical protein